MQSRVVRPIPASPTNRNTVKTKEKRGKVIFGHVPVLCPLENGPEAMMSKPKKGKGK